MERMHFALTEFEQYCKEKYEKDMRMGKDTLSRPIPYSEFEGSVGTLGMLYLNHEIFHEQITTNTPGHTVKYIENGGELIDVVLHKRYSYPVLHNHAYVELIYVASGHCIHFIENSSFTMNEGDVCILAPDAMHAVSAADDDAVVINILLSKSLFDHSFLKMVKGGQVISHFFEDVLYNQRVSPYLLFPTGDDQIIYDLIMNVYKEQTKKDYLYKESVVLYMKQVFIHLIRSYELMAIVANPMDNSHENNVVALMGYININYSHVTLKETAQFFGYNENYFGKMIQRYTGKKFSALVSDIQMEHAKRLLEESDLSITEVGGEVGCYDTSHFTRKFKACYGVTPNAYRKQFIDLEKEDIESIVYEVVNAKAASDENKNKRAPKPINRKKKNQ